MRLLLLSLLNSRSFARQRTNAIPRQTGFSWKRYNYDKDMYDEKRRKGELAAAIEQGVEQGIAIGYDKGHAQGVEQVAKNMLAAGLPYEQISQFTGLDLDTIQHMASSMTEAE